MNYNKQCHGEMPPLNKKGFVKLDDFQVETVRAIDEGINCIVSAPYFLVNLFYQDIC